jgi:hypothetical protein
MGKKTLTIWENLPAEVDLLQYEGFVYLIVNVLTDKKYIGRKYLSSTRKKKVKGKKRRSVTVTESDWRYYKSSSKELKADIDKYGEENFKFIILDFFKTKAETNYAEVKEQFSRDVLYSKLPNGEFEYYNYCILNRYWRKNEEV